MMPKARAMNVAIFLDEVNAFNGPLMFIPGSHKRGVVDARHDLTTTSYPLWTVSDGLITERVDLPSKDGVPGSALQTSPEPVDFGARQAAWMWVPAAPKVVYSGM